MTLTPERWQHVLALLDELLELDTAARTARLAEIARDDAELAREVRRLIAADAASGLLDAGIDALAPAVIAELAASDRQEAALDRSGERIGEFTLQSLLGRGGMGEVYLAERVTGDLRQQVALKVLKRGMDSLDIVRRFARERRILAHLNHPHIAQFIDGGVSADGRPFYAMERVEGVSLTAYARTLDVRRRVELLAVVCDAVAYAHAQLIVHRDLKPSNVLVDGNGQPRVLDFGIAKLLAEGDDGEATASGLRAMSPAYAAPEQILGQRIGIAADVYALGAMLYELLTGELPHRREAESLEALVLALSDETATAPSATLRRRANVQDTRRAREVDADLDLVVLQALKREPERRYGSAAALAEDLRRWLDGRPIAARPDTLSYRLGKFVRRHRGGVTAALLVVLAVLAGLGVALWQADIARREAARAREAAATAQREAKKSERLAEFLQSLLVDVDPMLTERKEPPSLRDVLREGGERVERELGDEPLLQAQLMLKFAMLSVNLRDEETAERLVARAHALVQALPAAPPETRAEALILLSERHIRARELDTARPLLEQALALLQDAGLAAGSMAASVHNQLGVLAYEQGRIDDSIAHGERAIAIHRSIRGEDTVRVSMNLYNLAMMQGRKQRWADAEANLRAASAIDRKLLGDSDGRIGIVLSGLADALAKQEKFDQAAEVAAEALRVLQGAFPASDGFVVGARYNAAEIAMQRGDDEAAIAGYREVARLSADSGNHANLGRAHRALGIVALNQGRGAEALREFQAARNAFTTHFGADHPGTLMARVYEAQATMAAGRAGQALQQLRALQAPMRAKTGEHSVEMVFVVLCQSEALLELREWSEAAAMARSALAESEAVLGPRHRYGTRANFVAGLALAAGGDALSAQPFLRAGVERAKVSPQVGGPLPLLARARAALQQH